MALGGIVGWSVDELYSTLYEEEWISQDFLQQIVEHQIDGETLMELSKDDLRDEFGITRLGDLKAMLRHIRHFHHKHGGTFNSNLNASAMGSSVGSAAAMGHSMNESTISTISLGESVHNPAMSASYNSSFLDSPGSNKKAAKPKRFQTGTAAKLNKPLSAGGKKKKKDILEDAFENAVLGPKDEDDHAPLKEDEEEDDDRRLPPLRPNTHLGFYSEKDKEASTPKKEKKKTDTAVLKAGSLDLALAKAKGRPKRARERRERQALEEQGLQPSAFAFQPGLLEIERRLMAVRKIFLAWTGGDEDAEVEGSEVVAVLQAFQYSAEGEDGGSASMVSGEVMSVMKLDDFQDFMSSAARHLPPAIFDDLVQYFYVALGDVAKKSEHARRFSMWQDMFRIWDVSVNNYITTYDLALVLELFNMRAEEDNEDWIVFRYDEDKINTNVPKETTTEGVEDDELNKDNRYSVEEFIELMMKLSHRWGREDFDVMYYKITGCVHSLEDELGTHVKKAGKGARPGETIGKGRRDEITLQYLQSLHDRQPPTRPFLFFGKSFDPTKTVENLAGMNGIYFKGLVVASERSEETALKKLKYNGYDNIDNFLRGVSVLLQTTPSWMVHRTFRLWMLVPLEFLMEFPAVMLMKSIPIPLDDKEGLDERAACYYRPNSPHLPFHKVPQ
eukprot:TRINITY_DN46963_c0_g1_i2.p1 TRINITY_DN46963_c0_g1~~TRINITY_DN46963_c0_g1_i2.p1  ORF type:complete len:672 (+),score=101.15 TRINITY_DN46963_c0_g1_i2:42-2057(+)